MIMYYLSEAKLQDLLSCIELRYTIIPMCGVSNIPIAKWLEAESKALKIY